MQFTLIYRESGTSLTTDAGPRTGSGTQLSVWKFHLEILDCLSKYPVLSASVWETQISLPIYIPTETSEKPGALKGTNLRSCLSCRSCSEERLSLHFAHGFWICILPE